MNPVSQGSFGGMIVPIILIYIIFYFVLIRPQRKEQKEHKGMLETLKKNDEIVTTGGIHGTIVNVKDKTYMVRIDDNVKLEINKSAIANKKTKTN
ncbi:preprotein translocase subunit YajC [Thermoproteota archaeon]